MISMSIQFKYILPLVCILIVFSAGCGCISHTRNTTLPPTQMPSLGDAGVLTVAFLDVGHGDSAVITCGNTTIVVDTGSILSTEHVLNYLYTEHIEDVDYMFVTHPHADHDGGVSAIYRYYTVNRYYDNHNTSRGDIIEDGDIRIEILNPVKGKRYADVNDASIVMRVTRGEYSMLLVGDAETVSENNMIDAGCDIDSDVIKIGHHGSKSSSSLRFLQGVSPELAVISCNDKYGNPDKEISERLNKLGVTTYITGNDGDIILNVFDNAISVKTTKSDIHVTYASLDGSYILI